MFGRASPAQTPTSSHQLRKSCMVKILTRLGLFVRITTTCSGIVKKVLGKCLGLESRGDPLIGVAFSVFWVHNIAVE